MKIAVIGAGAMGCRFGEALLRAGAGVTLFDIWEEHIDAINAHGLCVVSLGEKRYIKIPAVSDFNQIREPDAVIIFTKSQHTETAVRQAMAIMGSTTPVVTLQNGLGNIDILKNAVGRERVIAGITNYPTDLLGPGSVCVDGTGFTRLMALDPKCANAAQELCALLKASGMNCEISSDIMKEIWEKLAFNNAMNCITALTKLKVCHMGGSSYGFALCLLIAEEVCNVAKAEGVNADCDAVAATFKKVLDPNESGNHLTSMLQDVLKRKPTEIDSICGAVIKRAAGRGINTPRLETLYNLIKIIEENYEEQVGEIGTPS